MQLLNELVHSRFPGKYMIAEDLKGEPFINRGVMGFDTQWDPSFFDAIKSMSIRVAADETVDTGRLNHHMCWGM